MTRFKVYRIGGGRYEYIVYDIVYRNGYTYFLIYDGQWEWVDAHDYAPVEVI